MNEDKLKKLKDLLEISNRASVSPEDVVQVVSILINIIKKENKATDESIASFESRLQAFISKEGKLYESARNSTLEGLQALKREITALLAKSKAEVLAQIPEIPEFPSLDKIESDIKTLQKKEVKLDTATEIKDKLETLKKDERLDASAIKGLDKLATTERLDRAISILDQRTKFLINKPTGSSSGTVGPGTTNELAYFNSSTTVASLSTDTYPSLTELSYVKGVTSAIQTQINTKAPSTAPTFATSITGSYLTASELLITDGSKNIVSAAVATYPSLTELTYLKGVTSAIQTQLNAKGNVSKVGTPADNQVGVFTGDGTIEGTSTLTFSDNNLNLSGFTLLGDSISGYDTGTGFWVKLGVNLDDNKQAWFGDPDYEGVGAATFIRFFSASGKTYIDGVDGTDSVGRPLYVLNGIDVTKITNLTSNGFVKTGSGNGTLSIDTSTYYKAADNPSFGTITTTGNIELGHASANTLSASGGVLSIEGVVIPTISSTNTLTNKRITQRVVTTTDDATAVIDVDTTDVYELSAVANNTEFTTTGTPTDGQKLIVRYKDAGVSKTLTWTFATAIGVTLPTATTAGKWGYVGCIYNSAASQWHAVAVTTQA